MFLDRSFGRTGGGVVCGGRTMVNKCYGTVSSQSDNPPDENTLFYIQSLSKGVTAVGAML